MTTPKVPRLFSNPQPPTNSTPQSLSNQNRRQVIATKSSQSETQQPKLSPSPKECPKRLKSPDPSFKWTNPDPFNTENENHSVRWALASPTRFDSDIDSVAPDSPTLPDSGINANANEPEVSIKQRIYNAIRAFGIVIKSRMKFESESKREERKARESLRRKSVANGAARAKTEDARMRAQLDVHYDEERRKNSNARRKAREIEIEIKAKEKRRKAQEQKQADQEKRERKEVGKWEKK
ncbi:hypothetical protein EAE96_002130 [Botrytis aclada]|nr:hypothetical protein EAE96_002130 [Botrytis aclada]